MKSSPEYVVDTANGDRLGVVEERYEGSVYLRPPGGGAPWATSPDALRCLTRHEMMTARGTEHPGAGEELRMWAWSVGALPTGREHGSVSVSELDPAPGAEPGGAGACDLCAAWRAEREVARHAREHRRVRRATGELVRHPDHRTWPGGQAVR
ncbi:hypothetical protein [Streptomyces sp. cg36]|uniref:hypothetical protein n=1 Tax=Streptomyces sp. cg36 TaxID=3238798 RepID=UPI0034E2683C